MQHVSSSPTHGEEENLIFSTLLITSYIFGANLILLSLRKKRLSNLKLCTHMQQHSTLLAFPFALYALLLCEWCLMRLHTASHQWPDGTSHRCLPLEIYLTAIYYLTISKLPSNQGEWRGGSGGSGGNPWGGIAACWRWWGSRHVLLYLTVTMEGEKLGAWRRQGVGEAGQASTPCSLLASTQGGGDLPCLASAHLPPTDHVAGGMPALCYF